MHSSYMYMYSYICMYEHVYMCTCVHTSDCAVSGWVDRFEGANTFSDVIRYTVHVHVHLQLYVWYF